MSQRAFLAMLLAAIIGAAIWALSPWVTGQKEPWDAENLYYFASLAAGGFLCGFSIPGAPWAHYAGSVAGQASYALVFLPMGPLFVLGVVFLMLYSLLFLAGAHAGSRTRLRRVPPASKT